MFGVPARSGWIDVFAFSVLNALRLFLPPPTRSHCIATSDARDLTTLYDCIFSAWQFNAFMDLTRVSSPPSILVHDHNGRHGRRRSTSRPAGLPFSSRTPGPMPMAIPNTIPDPAPPPLPPPRFINDLTGGSDPGWAWGNNPSGKFGKATESPANFPKSWGRDMGEKRQAQPLERPQHTRRDSSTVTVRSPTDADRRHSDFTRHQDEGYYSLSGPRTSAMSQQSVFASFLQTFSVTHSQTTNESHWLSQRKSSIDHHIQCSLTMQPDAHEPNQYRADIKIIV